MVNRAELRDEANQVKRLGRHRPLDARSAHAESKVARTSRRFIRGRHREAPSSGARLDGPSALENCVAAGPKGEARRRARPLGYPMEKAAADAGRDPSSHHRAGHRISPIGTVVDHLYTQRKIDVAVAGARILGPRSGWTDSADDNETPIGERRGISVRDVSIRDIAREIYRYSYSRSIGALRGKRRTRYEHHSIRVGLLGGARGG